jgi:predicted nucleic acid-binding protein
VIVVDTNVLVHAWLDTPEHILAEALLDVDPHWRAPYLWRSEFRNALTLYMRHRKLALPEAQEIAGFAEEQMYGNEYFVDPIAVLDLVAASTCTAYDCEFVALARELGIPLITTDKQILRDFPRIARPLAAYR